MVQQESIRPTVGGLSFYLSTYSTAISDWTIRLLISLREFFAALLHNPGIVQVLMVKIAGSLYASGRLAINSSSQRVYSPFDHSAPIDDD